MKRFFLLIVLVMVVSWIVASHRSPFRRPAGPPRHWAAERHGMKVTRAAGSRPRRAGKPSVPSLRRDEVAKLCEARDEVRQAFDEARDEVHQAFDEVRVALVSTTTRRALCLQFPPLPPSASEEAEGLPVPIVPGTRVTKAEAKPPAALATRASRTVVSAVSTQSLAMDCDRAALGHQGARRGRCSPSVARRGGKLARSRGSALVDASGADARRHDCGRASA